MAKYRIDKTVFAPHFIKLWMIIFRRAGFITAEDEDFAYVQSLPALEDEDILSALYDYEDFLEEVIEEDEEE